jgi:DNA polymerase-3 subunit delta
MYKAEFDKILSMGNFKEQNFILFGESSFFIDRYAAHLAQLEDANLLRFYFDEYDFSAAKAHLSQASLFGGTNLLLVKSEKKIPKKELETLFALCNKGDNRFIYAYYGSDHKSYNNAFKKFGVITVRFFHPKPNEAIAILKQEAQERSLNIDGYTLNHLLNLHNGNIELALSELDKLSLLPVEQITNKEIDTLVFGMGEVALQTFVTEFWQKKEYSVHLETLLESGEDEIRIITSLTSMLHELYLFNIYIRIHGTADAKAILGYAPPQFVVNEKARLAMSFKPQSFYTLTRILLEAELAMKSANNDKRSILYATLISLHKNF